MSPFSLLSYKKKQQKCNLCFIVFVVFAYALIWVLKPVYMHHMCVCACSHAMTCSSVRDWQAVGWLKRAVSPAVCSQLHMRGASGERLVDLLLVVTFPHRGWQAKASYSNFTRTHLLTEGECNINFVLCVGKGRTLK